MENDFLESFNNFSKLDYKDRLNKLVELNFLSQSDVKYLQSGQTLENSGPDIELAQSLIENVLGYFHLPLGLAVNFIINKKGYVLPLAVEETSIIAAASKTARWVCQNGEITTEALGTLSTGQIQIPIVHNTERLKSCVKENFSHWKNLVNTTVLSSMVKRGGGLKDWELRFLNRPDGDSMAVLHLYIETCEAMGANIINQVCEYLKPHLEKASGEKGLLCILSNFADKRMVRAKLVVKNQEEKLIKKIEEASLFAEIDPYRASTNNKGVLNGVDALLIATGNDWRAVEAGLHAYASRKGHYSSLTKWRVRGGDLYGEMKGPFMLGTVGGVTDIHPTARLCLKILGYPRGVELAELCCALGLIQNLGALRALVTEGVIEGHMRLHIKNLAVKAGANTKEERSFLEDHLTHILKETKRVSLSYAVKTLKCWKRDFGGIKKIGS